MPICVVDIKVAQRCRRQFQPVGFKRLEVHERRPYCFPPPLAPCSRRPEVFEVGRILGLNALSASDPEAPRARSESERRGRSEPETYPSKPPFSVALVSVFGSVNGTVDPCVEAALTLALAPPLTLRWHSVISSLTQSVHRSTESGPPAADTADSVPSSIPGARSPQATHVSRALVTALLTRIAPVAAAHWPSDQTNSWPASMSSRLSQGPTPDRTRQRDRGKRHASRQVSHQGKRRGR